MEEQQEIDYDVEIDIKIKRQPIKAPKNTMEKILNDQFQNKVNLFASKLAIELEDRLNGKSVKRLPEPIMVDIRDLF